MIRPLRNLKLLLVICCTALPGACRPATTNPVLAAGPSAQDVKLPVGKQVIVQFRRDALGRGGDNATAPTTKKANGTTMVLTGTLAAASSEWLHLVQSPEQFWIPRESVLLIQVADE